LIESFQGEISQPFVVLEKFSCSRLAYGIFDKLNQLRIIICAHM